MVSRGRLGVPLGKALIVTLALATLSRVDWAKPRMFRYYPSAPGTVAARCSVGVTVLGYSNVGTPHLGMFRGRPEFSDTEIDLGRLMAAWLAEELASGGEWRVVNMLDVLADWSELQLPGCEDRGDQESCVVPVLVAAPEEWEARAARPTPEGALPAAVVVRCVIDSLWPSSFSELWEAQEAQEGRTGVSLSVQAFHPVTGHVYLREKIMRWSRKQLYRENGFTEVAKALNEEVMVKLSGIAASVTNEVIDYAAVRRDLQQAGTARDYPAAMAAYLDVIQRASAYTDTSEGGLWPALDFAARQEMLRLSQQPTVAVEIPDVARRHNARAFTLWEVASAPDDFDGAIKEWQLALVAAPWWPEPYKNLAAVFEKRRRYWEAAASLRLWLMAARGVVDRAPVVAKIYSLEYQAARKQPFRIGALLKDVSRSFARRMGYSDERGAVVADVIYGSPGARSGLLEGDVIIAIDGQAVGSSTAVRELMSQASASKDSMLVRVKRRDAEKELRVQLLPQ